MAATSSRSSPSSRRASLGAFGVGGFTAWVWLAVASTSAVAPVEAQYSPPPSPPPPPPSPPPPSPPPPSPPPPSPPPATGFTPTVRVLGTDTGLASVGAVNTTNCCQWYKWCDNTNVTVQCTSQLLTDCDAVVAGGGTWNASCAACGMCRDSAGSAADMRKKSYLAIDHAYQACIDTRRTVQTQAQVADPTITNQSVAKYTQIARDYTNAAAPDFVVCSTLNYKCLKQRSSAGCQVIPGVKIPGVKHSSTFGRSADRSSKDPRRGPVDGRLNLGSGMMVYDADRDFDKVADMHDRGNSTHTGFEYPYGITKFDGDGLHASYAAQTQYSPTSDPVGKKRRALFALRGEQR